MDGPSIKQNGHHVNNQNNSNGGLSEQGVTTVFLGASNMDLIGYAPRMARAGETMTGQQFSKCFGGKASNACVMNARLCRDGQRGPAMIAKIGQDDFGDQMLENWTDQGVSIECVKRTNESHSGVALIVVATETGQNCIHYIPGATNLLSKSDVQDAANKIFKLPSAQLFVSTFEADPVVLAEALKLAKAHNLQTLVNSAPVFPHLKQDVEREIFSNIDILCLNESETEHLTGLTLDDDSPDKFIESCSKAIPLLHKRGCDVIVLTLGEKGVLYSADPKSKPIHIPTDQVKPVDTTGAGDAFVGSLAYYLVYHPQLDMQEKLARAAKIATRSVTKEGAQTSYPYRHELPDIWFK